MLGTLAIAAILLAVCSTASNAQQDGPRGALLFESFNEGWQDRWQYPSVKKYKGRFETVQQEGFQDTAIQMPSGNLHYGISTVLREPVVPADGLVVQYEVKFSQGHTCGGAYLKLISETDFKPKRLKSKTPFSIMFGPDRCGPDARVHVIINALNPATNQVGEHHLLSAPEPRADKLSHVYTLVLHSNNRFKVLIDGVEQASGPIAAANWGPPLQPPETIPDPEHVKPDDGVENDMIDDPTAVKPPNWDDRRYIPDPHAVKPDGWLEDKPTDIPDTSATKPAAWNDEKDGVWLPPLVPNPACAGAVGCGPWKAPTVKNPRYKGPWLPPQINNPNYKGPWKQRTIPNPDHYKLESPLQLIAPITGVAFELWTTEPGYVFDSVLIGVGEQGLDAAAAFMRQTWRQRHQIELAAAMAASRANSRPAGVRYWASNTLQDLLDSQMLSAAKPQLQPVMTALQQTPEVAWALLLSLVVMAFGMIVMRIRRSNKVPAMQTNGAVEEADASGDESDEAWMEQLRQQRQAAKAAATQATSGADTAAATNSTE